MYSLEKGIMKSPYAILSGGLADEEERVDEIECKVFIKRSDSNLLWICTELALRDGLCSQATTCGIRLWSSL